MLAKVQEDDEEEGEGGRVVGEEEREERLGGCGRDECQRLLLCWCEYASSVADTSAKLRGYHLHFNSKIIAYFCEVFSVFSLPFRGYHHLYVDQQE